MDIFAALRRFDGKHSEPLVSVADDIISSGGRFDELLAIAEQDDVKLQVAATWVLKRCCGNGISFGPQTTNGLIELLSRVSHWEAQLHLLQIIPSLTIPPDKISKLWRTLIELTDDPNNFVRAWSYNLLAEIGNQQSRRRKKVLELLESAEQDKAASVRARIRQIRKRLPWTRTIE